MAIDYSKYKQQAQDEYNPYYESQKTSLGNTYADNQNTLNAQKTGINSNYDQAVINQNRTNTINKNNISNSALGRGLSRSSIVTSGLAQADNQNARLVNSINLQRTGELNNIDTALAQLGLNYNNSLNALELEKQAKIMELARELEGIEWDRNYKQSQFDWQKEQDKWNRDYQQKAFDWGKEQDLWNRDYQQQTFDWTKQQDLWNRGYQDRQLAVQQANAAAQDAYYKAMANYYNNGGENQKKPISYADRVEFANSILGIYSSDEMTDAQKIQMISNYANSGDPQLDALTDRYISTIQNDARKADAQKRAEENAKKSSSTKNHYYDENASDIVKYGW